MTEAKRGEARRDMPTAEDKNCMSWGGKVTWGVASAPKRCLDRDYLSTVDKPSFNALNK